MDPKPQQRSGLPTVFAWSVGAALVVQVLEALLAMGSDNALLGAQTGAARVRYLALIVATFPVTAAAGFVVGGLVSQVRPAAGRGLAALVPGLWAGAASLLQLDGLRSGNALIFGCASIALALFLGLLAVRRRGLSPRSLPAALLTLGALALLAFGRAPGEEAAVSGLRRGARAGSTSDAAVGKVGPDQLRRPVARNMLVLLVDTLRSDHLSCYGYGRETTPSIDRLAAGGVLFKQALTPKPKTSPAVASLFTGKWPQTHRIYQTGIALPDEHETIAEAFSAAGYETFGSAANINISAHFNFDQGFDEFVQVRPEGDPQGSQDGRVRDAFLAWLDGRDDPNAPFYGYLHFVDPHSHYIAPEPFRDMFRGDELDGVLGDTNLPVNPDYYYDGIHKTVFQEELGTNLDHYVARYDGEIRYTDSVIGDVLDALEQRGLTDSTAVVFTADHGESMAEHNVYFNHGLMTYEEQLLIPMIVRAPGLAAGAKRAEQVSLVDLMPTVLDLMGLEVPASVEGRPFTSALLPGAPPAPSRPTFASATALLRPWMHSVRDGRYKLTLRADGLKPDDALTLENLLLPSARARFSVGALRNYELAEQLYDLETDPGELVNLAWREPEHRTRLFGELFAFRAKAAPGGPLRRHLPDEGADDGVLQNLRDLGYIDIDDDLEEE